MKIKILIIIICQIVGCIFNQPIICAQTNDPETYFSKGQKALNKQNYDVAIISFRKCLELLDADDYNMRATCLYILGACQCTKLDYSLGTEYLEKAYSIPHIDKNIHNKIEDALLNVYQVTNSKEKAYKILNRTLKRFSGESTALDKWYSIPGIISALDYLGEENKIDSIAAHIDKVELNEESLEEYDQTNLFNNKNSYYTFMGYYNERKQSYNTAIKYFENALIYTRNDETRKRGFIKSKIGYCYISLNNPKMALEFFIPATVEYEKEEISSYNDFVDLYNIYVSLANLYEEKSQIYEANKILHKAENLCILFKDDSRLTYCYAVLYQYFNDINDRHNSQKYEHLLSTYAQQGLALKDSNSTVAFYIYAQSLERKGNYSKAENVYNTIIDLIKSSNDEDTDLLIACYSQLSELYALNHNYEKQNEYSIKISNISKNEKNLETYIKAKLFLMDEEQKQGNLGIAISIGEQLSPRLKELNDMSYVSQAYNRMMAELYTSIGNYGKAVTIYENEREFCIRKYGPKSRNTSITLLNLGSIYSSCERYKEALDCYTRAEKNIKEIDGIKSKLYYSVINHLSYYYEDVGNIKKRDPLMQECLELAKELYGDKSTEYAFISIRVASIELDRFINETIKKNGYAPNFLELGEKQIEYFKLYEHSLELLELNHKDNTIAYIQMIEGFTSFSNLLLNTNKTFDWDKKLYNSINNFLLKNYHHLIDWEREYLGESLQKKVLNSFIRIAVESGSSTFSKLAFNSCLLAKGLQLSSSNTLNSIVRNSKNKELIKLHQEINFKKKKQIRARNDLEFQRISKRIHELQRREVEEIKNLGLFTDFIKLDYTHVLQSLKDNDVAIEFSNYKKGEVIHYVALVVTPTLSDPCVIELFNEKDLNKFKIKDICGFDYSNPKFYEMVWGSLDNEILQNTKNIYFSASGILNKIAIENLCDTNGIIASKKWNLFRLSSTRNLLNGKREELFSNIALYGGLSYDMDEELLIKESNKTSNIANRFRNVNNLRDKAISLPGSLYEIMGIKSQLERNNKKCTIYSGIRGTEYSFKNLPIDSLNIIHLATHGFYCEPSPRIQQSTSNFSSNRNKNIGSILQNSGLLFSGVNCILSGRHIPEFVDDGILTSKEISLLDLHGVDLVVLSACQSGLGEINEEGVIGLQRGFKLAGVNSLLMSLWKVDDKATAILMIEFYKNLLKGETKVQALNSAQEYLRKLKDFSDPRYWAGFIVLDAL